MSAALGTGAATPVRFDPESWTYGYSFSKKLQDEWNWEEHFASQPETERYLNYLADKFDLRRDIQCSIRVAVAQYHEDTKKLGRCAGHRRTLTHPSFDYPSACSPRRPCRVSLASRSEIAVPLRGRQGTARDVASAALSLASDEANLITGVSLPVDDGMLVDIARAPRLRFEGGAYLTGEPSA